MCTLYTHLKVITTLGIWDDIFPTSANANTIRNGASNSQPSSQYPSSAVADKPHVQFLNCGSYEHRKTIHIEDYYKLS